MLNDYGVSNQRPIVRRKVLAIDYRSDMTIDTSSTLRHVVLFAFRDSATVEQIDAVVADFGTLKERNGYLLHAAHQAFVDTLGACLEKSLVVDYWAQ